MYLIQTVQTTWRPQLPLPKELQLTDERHNDTKLISTKADIHYTQNYEENYQPAAEEDQEQEQDQQQMDRLRGNHGGSIGGSSQQLSHKQKWSFGRLFRGKKKDAAECSPSSSEEDRKAGFVPTQRQSTTGSGKPKGKPGKSAASRGSSRYEEQAPPPPPPHPSHSIDNEFFLPVETIQQQPEPYYQNQPGPSYYHRSMSNSLDRRGLMQQQPQPHPQHMGGKSRSAQRKPPGVHHSSAEEELISLNSSTFSKYRSDESIHSGGHALMQGSAQSQCPSQSQNSRRSRAARNERYYKRLSRDGEQSHGGVPPLPNPQRYKTQPLPLSIYQPSAAYVQWQPQQQQQQQPPQRPLQNTFQSDGKRSISYDSHIHLQNVNGRMQSKPLPPPPPPRDPLRRVHAVGSSSGDLRPVSYAFDTSGRCVSDDRIWQPAPHYQSVHSLNSQPSSSIASAPPVSQQQHHRRFITRSERNANPGKQSLPNGIDFHYVADATPRSRKPIHMMEADKQEATPPSSGMLRTSKSGLPTAAAAAAPQPILKPRSISSSRLSEMRGGYPMPMYSEVLKPKRTTAPAPAANPLPDQDTVVCGSLQIKPNYVEIRHRDVVHKTNSMPHHYQRRSGEDLPNKYEEYVAEKREQHQQAPPPVYPERKQSLPAAAPVYFPRKKPANLEEAINELEAIYKSLGLTEPQETKAEVPEMTQMETPAAPKMRVPTPSDFEKFALAHADEYDDEDSPTGEPDPVRDDVAYRNLQLANLQHRSSERQPPFGIPVGPIVPAPQSDYLHVEPIRVIKKKKSTSPDIVKDDLAVRALRKDPPGPKSSFHYPMQKKQRATRTQSANIYNLIHRDAAKPSGGDLRSYMELTKSIERAGSMSNLQAEATSDIPATLDLLRKLKAQDEEMEAVQKKAHAIPFRHPSQGGAIAHLPERLITKEEAPKAPPVAAPRKSLTPEPHLDDALNKIAQDAQASSIKLSQELHELRREALITAARPKLNAEQQKLENELQEIDAVSKAAKRCGQMLLDNLPDAGQEEEEYQMQPQRKLHKEGKLIRAIDEVSEAANAVCEKILKDIVTTEPPVIVHEARQVKQPTGAAQTEHLVMPNLIKKLDPIQSEKMEHIARRCMRQLSELAEAPQPDYDNLPAACNINAAPANDAAGADATLISTVPETLEEIDKIMQECERQAKGSTAGSGSTTDDQRTTAPSITSGSNSNSHSGGGSSCPPNVSTTASSFSSSSDCLAKSSSPSTASRLLSSSITSFNPYSSSDYIKSQSSDYHAPSTDPIKTFSTTSYDVQSTTANNTTNSTMSTTNNTNTISSCTSNPRETNPETTASCSSVSPQPLQLTPVRGTSSSPSQYNSSEELAAIFGIEEQPKQRKHRQQQQQKHTETIAASSDLSTASATAKSSCHKPQENSQTSPSTSAPKARASEDSSGASKSSGYRGQHPHFYHHTTPAYYTDLQLKIHTPQATDVGALNENYQSVYATPSCNTQLVEQRRSFPKSATRATFFRGDAASTQDATRRRQRPGSEGNRYFKYSPGSVSPTKGEETSSHSHPLSQSPTIIRTPSHSHSPSITRTRTTNRDSCSNPPVETASPVPAPAPASAPGRNSRHKQRFHQRSKRAVRVRSESRPISALYDIICKEKNQDEGDSTTSSSSSSTSSGNNSSNEKEKETKEQQQLKDTVPITDKLATFWPLHHRFHTPPPSMQKEPPPGGATTATATSLMPRRGVVVQPENSSSADSLHALHSSHNCTNLVAATANAKAASLPPQPARRAAPPAVPVPVSHHQRLAKSLEPSAKTTAPPASADVRNYDAGRPVNTERLFVEPPKVSGLAVQDFKRRLINQGDGHEDAATPEEQQFDQGEVFDTLARWQKELTSASDKIQLVNGAAATANGHHDHYEHHHHHSPHLEHDHHQESSLPSVESPVSISKHQHQLSPQHQHQATNARRFITRTTRSHSRQGSATGGHHTSPPPPLPLPLLSSASAGAIIGSSTTAAGYHSDSSYSSPSPTRRRNKPLIGTGTGTLSTDPQSSANGNSSAYETAATTVMTHGPAAKAPLPPPPPPQQQQQQQHRDQQQQQSPLATVEVPKAEFKPQPPTSETSISAAACPVAVSVSAADTAAGNSDKKKEEEQQQQRQRYSSPCSPRNTGTGAAATGGRSPSRRLSSSEISPKSAVICGFNSEPATGTGQQFKPRSTSQPADTPPTQRRHNLVAVGSGLSMKQNLSELHFTASSDCTLKMMRPRSSTLSTEQTDNQNGARDNLNLANLQLSPVQKHKRTPESSPRRLGDRDKSAKRKSNLNRSLTEEATKDGDEADATNRRRRRRELGMARPLVPGDDEALRDLLSQSPLKSSCSESTGASKSEPVRSVVCTYPGLRHPEVAVRTMTAVLPTPRPLHATQPAAKSLAQKFNERTRADLAEIKKIVDQTEEKQQQQQPEELSSQKMSAAALRRKSTDEAGATGAAQSSPPAPNQIVSILKKKEQAFGDCNSSASSNASPVTFSSSVMDPPLAGTARSKRQGILKKRSSLDESRYYSRSHSPDERSILIKSARRNSLEEAGTGLSPAQSHGILKQSSYDSSKSDGCPSATESQPHSILKKKDSLSTPSDGGCHKHVSISQAVTLAAAELAAHHDGSYGLEDVAVDADGHEIRPILKQESTSSEEAVRPPKPILKKKSFGEADEHEAIRPILKSSRKSSREEFDLSGLDHEGGNDSPIHPILKTDSPSKRRSLGSNHDQDSPSLLKRRTRSLERPDAPPVIDLAAALDAISTSQAAAASNSSTPVDFVTTPSSISVAERIKRMEMLATPTSRLAGGINSSWESPLQQTPEAAEGSPAPRLLKPSVLRRDLQRERYKTQPVTSEEKSFFKANSTPFDISSSGASSAFKPTKPLDIRLSHTQQQQQQQQPLISPITGQPLSHVPAPLLLSSSTHSGAGSSFRLARSSTQPLQSPRVVHLAAQGGQSSASPPTSSSTLLLARQHSINDSVNLSEQLTLSVGTDSEHIFEMSGLDEDSAIQSLSDDVSASASASATAAAAATTTPASGLARSNSVRARANMFQQLQQEQSSRSRRSEAAASSSAAAAAAAGEQSTPRATGATRRQSSPGNTTNPVEMSSLNDDPMTPNNTQDAEFEPSSLSLAERLAFFSNLCDGSAGSASGGGRYRSRTSSYSRSPPIERTTPRSSTTANSSCSVTPTPMECSPIPYEQQPSSLTLEIIREPEQPEQEEQQQTTFHELSRSATEPCNSSTNGDTTQTFIKGVRLRTVGKLILPDTFRGGDRNNNKSGNISMNRNSYPAEQLHIVEAVKYPMNTRAIGKIKSPFFEQQQHQSTHTVSSTVKPVKFDYKQANGSTSGDSGSDSGKENCASNQQQQQQQPPQVEALTLQKIVDMRRKISRLVQGQSQEKQQLTAQPVNRRHTTEITSSSMGAVRSPSVDGRYAKYFGVQEAFNSTTTVMKTQSMPPLIVTKVEATNEHVRQPGTPALTQKRREMLKRTRPISLDTYTNGSISPTAMPSPKRAHSPSNRAKATISSFEDIEVTPQELNAAGKDFKRLCVEILD
ncbi:pneumococcal serine-rich repeat protein [Drosophila madeirensis]|uniref:Pneumococcal serine-rich repeat protein n=1 Tax=Drosophila madeirensis TaxID=30013 RepID=A0AAU9FTQ5_DROMD